MMSESVLRQQQSTLVSAAFGLNFSLVKLKIFLQTNVLQNSSSKDLNYSFKNSVLLIAFPCFTGQELFNYPCVRP